MVCHDFRCSWCLSLFGRRSAVVVTGFLAATGSHYLFAEGGTGATAVDSWGEQSFCQLKALFTSAPVLAHPDPSLAFIVGLTRHPPLVILASVGHCSVLVGSTGGPL